jgi:hypothetical protein
MFAGFLPVDRCTGNAQFGGLSRPNNMPSLWVFTFIDASSEKMRDLCGISWRKRHRLSARQRVLRRGRRATV